MESYSIFSSSTNSASFSSNNNNFPFSLSHDHFDGSSFDMKYDHRLDHHGSEQSEPLISATTTMIQNDHHHQQYDESSMLESQTLIMSDYHHDNDQTADDDSERKITVNKNDDNISNNKGKKGLLSSEKKIKKHRYAFQTRSPVDILDDGFRWRKYGQKAVKNNKFPRSYYRCTQQGCNVKKQVQRLSKDEEVVVTTYEGMHSHSIMDSSNTDNFEHILSQMQIYSSF